jgi:3-isopropylmalate/(R)-2-methylmalate dehydratase small subunit
MEKFTILTGVAAPMMMPNIDTDAIIPSQWVSDMKADLGEKLFADWRYLPAGGENTDFILNQPRYRQSRILLAGKNFGCGSSREMAVWALMRFGFKAVIAPSFGEIFVENSFQNGLLPIALAESVIETILETLDRADLPVLTIDLQRCEIDLPDGAKVLFTVNDERRIALLEGLDELGQLLRFAPQVSVFQEKDRGERPWIYDTHRA